MRGGGGGNAREIKIKKTKKKGRKDADSDEESQGTTTGLQFYFSNCLFVYIQHGFTPCFFSASVLTPLFRYG